MGMGAKEKIMIQMKKLRREGQGVNPLFQKGDHYTTTQWRAELEGKSSISRTIVNRSSSVSDIEDIELVQYILGMYKVL